MLVREKEHLVEFFEIHIESGTAFEDVQTTPSLRPQKALIAAAEFM
jgi:hypothetical protein